MMVYPSFSRTCLASVIVLMPSVNVFAQLEEVVVTAQKRAESLQDVPISVSAMSGEKIQDAGIPNFQEFSAYIPNFNVTSNAIGDVVSIRGVQSGILASIEQSVGTYVDGIYRGRGTQSRFSFLDVGMIEVLRGPQGTLFGKNTIGGALNITSAAPTEQFESVISTLYEIEHVESELQAYVAGPISETLRGRVALMSRDMDDGWVENDYYNQGEPQLDEMAGRVSLHWDATETLFVKFKYEHGEWDNAGQAFEESIVSPQLVGTFAALGIDGATVSGDKRTRIGNDREGIDYGASQIFDGDIDEAALQTDYSLEHGTVTAILGYSSYDFARDIDADFNAFDGVGFEERESFDQTSFELRFVSELGNGFEYIAGLYWQDSDLDLGAKSNFNVDPADANSLGPIAIGSLIAEGIAGQTAAGMGLLTGDPVTDATITQGVAVNMVSSIGAYTRAATLNQTTESIAVFAQGSWDLSDAVRLTVGGRYGEEEKQARQGVHCTDWDTFNIDDLSCTPLQLVLGEFRPHQNDDLKRDEAHWTWSTNIQWDVNDAVMVYATASTGVKSGGFNSFSLTTSPEEAEFDEEEVLSFEVGAKMTLLDGDAELNLAVFDMAYDDLQATIFTGSTGFKVENAASASIRGIEMDGRWQVADGWMLRGSVGYTDFEFDQYNNAGCTNAQKQALGFAGLFTKPAPGTQNGGAVAVDLDGNGSTDACEQDLSGGTNPFTPELSASVSLEYEVAISRFMLRTALDANYMGEHDTAQDNDPLAVQGAYTLINMTMTLAPQDDSWDISLIGRNLTDESYVGYSNDMPLFAGNQQVAWGRSANYAIRGRLRF